MLGLIIVLGSLFSRAEDPEIANHLKNLGADEYSERKLAQENLISWGREDVRNRVSFFRRMQNETSDPEVQERCREIVKELVLAIVDEERNGFMGINLGRVVRNFGQKPQMPRGVTVNGVIKKTAAEKFGLKEGDLILKIDELDLSGFDGPDKLIKYVGEMKNGTTIEVHLEREEEKLTIPLTLMTRPREADLSTRKRLPGGRDLDAELTEFEREEIRRSQEQDIQKWLRDNKLENSDG